MRADKQQHFGALTFTCFTRHYFLFLLCFRYKQENDISGTAPLSHTHTQQLFCFDRLGWSPFVSTLSGLVAKIHAVLGENHVDAGEYNGRHAEQHLRARHQPEAASWERRHGAAALVLLHPHPVVTTRNAPRMILLIDTSVHASHISEIWCHNPFVQLICHGCETITVIR